MLATLQPMDITITSQVESFRAETNYKHHVMTIAIIIFSVSRHQAVRNPEYK